MYYTVYKITNLINNKVYIGKHQTKNLNDGYMGSGGLIRQAIKKHGINNFYKEILFVFNNEAEMNAKEREIVTEEFCRSADTYNMAKGGSGGGYVWGALSTQSQANIINNARANGADIFTKLHRDKKVKYDTFSGKKHTQETKDKMSATKGSKITIDGVVYSSLSKARQATGKSLFTLKRHLTTLPNFSEKTVASEPV